MSGLADEIVEAVRDAADAIVRELRANLAVHTVQMRTADHTIEEAVRLDEPSATLAPQLRNLVSQVAYLATVFDGQVHDREQRLHERGGHVWRDLRAGVDQTVQMLGRLLDVFDCGEDFVFVAHGFAPSRDGARSVGGGGVVHGSARRPRPFRQGGAR